jgi:uncharacterized protein YdeI (YjbR/CyaY-like superfamily)
MDELETRPDATARMRRQIYPMPDDVRLGLEQRGLMAAYRDRPMYQQNDYVGWITRAKRSETRQKRLDQMLEELTAGGVYMRMRWSAET